MICILQLNNFIPSTITIFTNYNGALCEHYKIISMHEEQGKIENGCLKDILLRDNYLAAPAANILPSA